MRNLRLAPEARGKYGITAAGQIEEIQKAKKVRGHFEEAQSVAEGCGINHQPIIFLRLQKIVDGNQRGHLCHAGQVGGKQGLDFLAGEKAATLQQRKNFLAVPPQEFFEQFFGVDLPGKKFAFVSGNAPGRIGEAKLKDVSQRMRRIGGNEQHRLARMRQRAVHGKGRGNRGFAYASFAEEERKMHDVILASSC